MTDRTILIIRTGGLGDSVLLWPALVALRARSPSAQIHLLGNADRLAPLVVDGGADRVLSVEGSGLHQLLAYEAEPDEPVRERFGAYQTVVAFAAQGDYALGENLAACGIPEVHVFLPFPGEQVRQHAADYLLECLQTAALAGDGPGPAALLPVTEAERSAGAAHLAAGGLEAKRLALLVPGSGSQSKLWPAERFAALAEGLAAEGLRPVLVAGPADRAAVDAVQAAACEPLPVLADESPALLKGLLAQADVVVANDSGPAHLAALIGAPTAAVFGPTDPDRWRPRGPRVELIQAEDLDLASVSVERVAAACRRLRQP